MEKCGKRGVFTGAKISYVGQIFNHGHHIRHPHKRKKEGKLTYKTRNTHSTQEFVDVVGIIRKKRFSKAEKFQNWLSFKNCYKIIFSCKFYDFSLTGKCLKLGQGVRSKGMLSYWGYKSGVGEQFVCAILL